MVGNVVAGAGLKGLKTTVRGECPFFLSTVAGTRNRVPKLIRNSPSISDLEGLLLYYRAIEKPSPALLRSSRNDDSDIDDEDDLDEAVGGVNSRASGIRSGGAGLGTGRGQVESDDDSDFDL